MSEGYWEADETDAWEMAQLAASILGADTVYRAPYEHMHMFMLLTRFRLESWAHDPVGQRRCGLGLFNTLLELENGVRIRTPFFATRLLPLRCKREIFSASTRERPSFPK